MVEVLLSKTLLMPIAVTHCSAPYKGAKRELWVNDDPDVLTWALVLCKKPYDEHFV
jgi:hypothetical protein